jgi:hypothetical protein
MSLNLSRPKDNAAARRVVGGDRHCDVIAQNYLNTELSHLSREVRDDQMVLAYLYAENTARQNFGDDTVEFNLIVLTHFEAA